MKLKVDLNITNKKIKNGRDYSFNYKGTINGREVKGRVEGDYSITVLGMKELLRDKNFLLEKIMEKEI